jgi:hypothetical protein
MTTPDAMTVLRLKRALVCGLAAVVHANLISGRDESSRRPQSSVFRLIYLPSQMKIAVTEDRTLDVSSLHRMAGQSLSWREILRSRPVLP